MVNPSNDARDDDPLVLVGEPRMMRGVLTVRNPGAERMILREGRLSTPSVDVRVPLAEVLQPGSFRRIALRVDLGGHVPPGEHRGTFEVSGRTCPAILHVGESVRLTISPSSLVVSEPPGRSARKRVAFANEGNVPLTIGDIGPVPLGEELLGGAARVSVTAAPSKLDELVAELARAGTAPRLLREAGTLRVHGDTGPAALEPGEVRVVDLVIDVPEGLAAGARYVGRLPIYTSDLEFVAVPTADRGSRVREDVAG